MPATTITLRLIILMLLSASSHGIMEISESTEWTTGRNLTERVVIQNDQTLTIRGPDAGNPIVIDLNDKDNNGGGFQISPNAKLIFENVILTRWNEEGNVNAVTFVEDNSGFVKFHKVRCQNMATCIALKNGNNFEVSDSIFRHNHKAVTGTNSRSEIIKTSLFVENEIGVAGDEWILEDCVLMLNNEASVGERTQFTRTLFLDNAQAAVDPNGSPNPFLSDCIFYKNAHAIVPNCCGTPHASMSQVSFIYNQVAVYCTSELSEMKEVNLINSTEWNLVYAGNTSTYAIGEMYWGVASTKEIREKLFDFHKSGSGGVVHVRHFAKDPFLHDLLVQMLQEKPTTLLKDLELYLGDADWQSRASAVTEPRMRSQFDFTLLREWEASTENDVVLETQAEETKETESVTDSDNVVVEVPKDVVDGSVNEQETSQPVEQETSQSVEDSKKEQRHGPYDTASKTGSSRFEFHVHDEDQWILFVSLGLNLCFIWIVSFVAFDCCCKKQLRDYFKNKRVLDSDDENEEEGLLDVDVDGADEKGAEEEEDGVKTL